MCWWVGCTARNSENLAPERLQELGMPAHVPYHPWPLFLKLFLGRLSLSCRDFVGKFLKGGNTQKSAYFLIV